MSWPTPISYLQLAVFGLVVIVGAISVVMTATRNRQIGDEASKSRLSSLGIGFQAIAFAATGLGQIKPILSWSTFAALLSALIVGVLGAAAIAIFKAAAAAMGRNWSVVARTRSDHELVRSGPFAVVRHPIYLALLLYLLSFAVAFGHILNLVIAIPFYLLGTAIRIREEEKLLRSQFGEDHAHYVREVPAFIPFIR